MFDLDVKHTELCMAERGREKTFIIVSHCRFCIDILLCSAGNPNIYEYIAPHICYLSIFPCTFCVWVCLHQIIFPGEYIIISLFSAVCALVGCVLMGPRVGRFKKGKPVPMPGHSVPLSALGGLILIFGFFACNGTKQVSQEVRENKNNHHKG